MFCDVEPEAVINNLTADSIYEVPLLMEQEGLDHIALKNWDLKIVRWIWKTGKPW